MPAHTQPAIAPATKAAEELPAGDSINRAQSRLSFKTDEGRNTEKQEQSSASAICVHLLHALTICFT
jgi:hypothetical protein